MWLHFRSFPESQIHFARKDKSGGFRIHSRGLQIKSQIGCSFCWGCVFICQEQLSSRSSPGACYCQSPRQGPALLPPPNGTPSRGLCPLLGPGSQCYSRGEGGEIGSPSGSFKEAPASGPNSLPPPGGSLWRKGGGILHQGPALWGREGHSAMPKSCLLQPLEEGWKGGRKLDSGTERTLRAGDSELPSWF